MTDKARELLRRALEALEANDFYDDDFAKFRTLPRKTRAYLAMEERNEKENPTHQSWRRKET